MKTFRFKKCEMLQLTAWHAAFPDNVSLIFESNSWSQIQDDYTCLPVEVELYSCGCVDCEGV